MSKTYIAFALAAAVAGMLFAAGCGGGIRTHTASDGDPSAPVVQSIAPASGSTNVPVSTSVSVTFSELVAEPSAESAFNLEDGAALGSGVFGP
jgi:hypothetical protein